MGSVGAGDHSASQVREAQSPAPGHAAGAHQLPSIAGTALPLRAARYRPGASLLLQAATLARHQELHQPAVFSVHRAPHRADSRL